MGLDVFSIWCYIYHFPVVLLSLVPAVPLVLDSAAYIAPTMAERPASIASSTPSSSWKGWLWDSADVSKEERRFLLKVGHPSQLLIANSSD